MRERAELALLRHAPAVTLDGIAIKLEANIELPEEAVAAMEAGADGIGLFRSEFLFMGRHDLPSEEEQYQARSEEHTSELQSLMRISYAVFCLQKKTKESASMRIERQSLHYLPK